MADDFHKPVTMPSGSFESFRGGEDSADLTRIAHETAQALLARVRADPQPEILDRLIQFTSEQGIGTVAELWARSSPHSLPGALWRLYLLQLAVRNDPEASSYCYRRGTEVAVTIDPVVAGAVIPTGPEDIVDLADTILHGVFRGDLAVALERAAAFCRISAAGAAQLADDADQFAADRATELTVRAGRYTSIGEDLAACAALWRRDALE